jgi:hypothetical protein
MLNFSSTAFIQILFKNAIYATQKAHYISITKKNNLILFSNVSVCFLELHEIKEMNHMDEKQRTTEI